MSLAARRSDVLASGTEVFEIATTNGGSWRGEVLPQPSDQPLLRVQSFY